MIKLGRPPKGGNSKKGRNLYISDEDWRMIRILAHIDARPPGPQVVAMAREAFKKLSPSEIKAAEASMENPNG